MKQFVAFLLTVLLATSAQAGHRGNVVQLVVPQFAVPVGVPVAPVAPAFYSYGQFTQSYAGQPASSRAMEDALAERIAAKVLAIIAGGSVGVRSTATTADAPTIIKQRCIRCHNGPDAKAGLDLDKSLDVWSREIRQEAILRMLSVDPKRRMPKGGDPLEAEEV